MSICTIQNHALYCYVEKSKEGGGKTLPIGNSTLTLEGWLRVGWSLSRRCGSMEQLVETEVLSYGAPWVRGVQSSGRRHVFSSYDCLELCKI